MVPCPLSLLRLYFHLCTTSSVEAVSCVGRSEFSRRRMPQERSRRTAPVTINDRSAAIVHRSQYTLQVFANAPLHLTDVHQRDCQPARNTTDRSREIFLKRVTADQGELHVSRTHHDRELAQQCLNPSASDHYNPRAASGFELLRTYQ